MKVIGVDPGSRAEDMEWDNVEEVHYDYPEGYYTLSFKHKKNEMFAGYIAYISEE
jgi:hypothetical protein